MVGFLTTSSATRLSRVLVPRLQSDMFTCGHTRTERGGHDFCISRSHSTDTDPSSGERAATHGQSGEAMTSASVGHILLTSTQAVGSGRGDRAHRLLTRSRTLYPPSYSPLLERERGRERQI